MTLGGGGVLKAHMLTFVDTHTLEQQKSHACLHSLSYDWTVTDQGEGLSEQIISVNSPDEQYQLFQQS